MPTQLLAPKELADYLGVPLKSVYKWRAERTGPRGLKVGRHVRYRVADVEAWLETLSDLPPATPGAAPSPRSGTAR